MTQGIASPKARRRTLTRSCLRLLVAAVLVSQLTLALPAPASASLGVIQTIGDFLSLGANTVRELQRAIEIAGGEIRATLEQLNNDLNALIQTLSETYQENLFITIDSLDAATKNKLLEIQGLITQINEQIQADITLAGDTAKQVIRDASLQLRRVAADLEQSLTNIIVVGGTTVAYVLDKAIYNAILVISLVLLGIGLLVFVVLLFRRRLPSGGLALILALLFMAIYVILFGALVVVPQARGYVMIFTGVGLKDQLAAVARQPRIFDVIPDTVILGETRELQVWGSSLRPDGKTPTATIANNSVPVSAASDQQVVLNVASLSGPEGSTNVVLAYDGVAGPTEVVRLIRPTPIPQPPDLTISAFSISPSSPVEGNNARASITVRNQGGSRAGSFVVRWRPHATHPGLSNNVSGLNASASQTFTFDFAYPNPGTFDSVATVDVNNTVAESNEGNNSATRTVTVQQRPPRSANVTVSFSQVTVHDDADPAASGELWLDFNISGQTGRWPSSGTRSVDSGNTYTVNKSFTVRLTEGQNLTIFVNGTDEDAPGFPTFDDHDPMGTVSKTFGSAAGWGQGSHSDRSTCPDGCYTIHYTISIVWLN